jgi:hypothetical protein
MALAIGSLTLVQAGATTTQITAPSPTGGSGSVTIAWYRSTSSPPAIGSTTLIAGASGLSLSDSGLTPGTVYYYEAVATDVTSATASTPVLTAATTAQSPSPNQFQLSPILGMVDQHLNYNTMACQFDPAGTGTLVPGQAVKFSTASNQSVGLAGGGNGLPLVVPSTATSDDIIGFVNYDLKSTVFNPGDRMQVSCSGNVIYLYAATALTRGNYVTSLPAGIAGGCNGGVIPATGSSALPIAGYAMDTAAIGTLNRIRLLAHSGITDASPNE